MHNAYNARRKPGSSLETLYVFTTPPLLKHGVDIPGDRWAGIYATHGPSYKGGVVVFVEIYKKKRF